MKKLLQKWLEVPRKKEIEEIISKDIPSKEAFMRMIGSYLKAVFQGKPDEVCPDYYRDEDGELIFIKNAAYQVWRNEFLPEAREMSKEIMEDAVSREAFIDEVIERINRKQLK